MNSDYEFLIPVKGAHGHVKKAIRTSDGGNVIIKLIKKEGLSSASWLEDPFLGRVPLEVAVLRKVSSFFFFFFFC